MVTRDNQTKLSAGVGLYYDRTGLDKLMRPVAGRSQDVFYAPDGVTPLGPAVITMFQADPGAFRAPHLGWNIFAAVLIGTDRRTHAH